MSLADSSSALRAAPDLCFKMATYIRCICKSVRDRPDQPFNCHRQQSQPTLERRSHLSSIHRTSHLAHFAGYPPTPEIVFSRSCSPDWSAERVRAWARQAGLRASIELRHPGTYRRR